MNRIVPLVFWNFRLQICSYCNNKWPQNLVIKWILSTKNAFRTLAGFEPPRNTVDKNSAIRH